MTVMAFLLLCGLNLIPLLVSSCGRCLCDQFSQSVFALVAVSKSSLLEGKAALSLNHLLAQDTLPKEYLLSWTSLLWDTHLKATAVVFKYLTVLEGIVVAERRVLDQELLLMEEIYFPMGWARLPSNVLPWISHQTWRSFIGQRAEHLQLVRKIKLVWSQLRVRGD